MASSTINRISDLIFNRRQQATTVDQLASLQPQISGGPTAPSRSGIGGMLSPVKEIYNILKSGLRRYEITEPECQSRLICDIHQKAFRRSLGPVTTTLFDFFGVESRLERSTSFSSRTKSMLKEFVRAARAGLGSDDCAIVYFRCPSNIAVEAPNLGGLLNGLMKPKVPQHQPLQQQPLAYTGNSNSNIKAPVSTKQRQPVKYSAVPSPSSVHYYSNINKL